ncbi:hypothetical protein MHBO_002911 [Bonamia ostreae]|uniref:Heat shock protein 60 n=1 Tax=Bonamia ostreae TaxID=126728 RepID=A0ABV2ANY4_9EUKA
MPNADQKLGAKIVRTAMRMPAQVICDNAGLEGAVITGRLLEDSENKIGLNKGMDALTGKFCDMVESGIVDPVKVTHTALSDSSSISGVMITTEAVICEKPKDGQKSDGGNPMEMPSSMRGGMNPMGVL